MIFRGVLAAILLTFIPACASKTNYPPPQVRVPAPSRWTAAAPVSGSVQGRWWTSFGDEQLNLIVEEALQRNYNLRAAGARIEAAAAQARMAGASLRPQVNASVNRSRQKQNFVGFPIPGAEGRVLSTTFTNVGASIDISWEADLWGRIRAGMAAAVVDLEASRSDLRAARLSIAAQTAKAWFAATEASQQIALAEATVENYQSQVRSARTRYERGLTDPLDLRLALSDLSRAAALLQQRKAQWDRTTRQLEILASRYPEASLQGARQLPPLPPPIPAGLPADLISRRPDLVAAERRLLAAGFRTHEAKRGLYPSFSLTSAASLVSNQLKDVLQGDFRAWSLVGGLFQPLYEGGRLRENVRVNQARFHEAEAVFSDVVLNAYGEVETALAAEQILAQREQDWEATVNQALAARKLAEDRYRGGLVDIITVLSSQQSALDGQSNLLTVRRERLDNRVDLHLALGGGFEKTPPMPPPPPPDAAHRLQEKNRS